MNSASRPIAVLDACILYSATLTDALLSFSVAGWCSPKWSREIEAEWMRSLERKRPDLSGKLSVRRNMMREAVPDWEVFPANKGSEPIHVQLPDPDDLHIVKAAIDSGASHIVRINLADFPAETLRPFGIRVTHPDDFLMGFIEVDAGRALRIFTGMRKRRQRPQTTLSDFTDALERSGLSQVARHLRHHAQRA